MSVTFISKYLEHNKDYESPSSFWRWSAHAAVAAVLRDNCYYKYKEKKIYTNVYILFLAESSGHRKGNPVDSSENLVNEINTTKVISGRASVQAIMDELSRVETDKASGKIVKAGSAIFYAQELSAGIVADPIALDVLCDIYDMKTNPYKNRLRTGPCFNLDRIVFSMLAASNDKLVRAFFDERAVGGGMLARTLLIMPNEQRKANSLLSEESEEVQKRAQEESVKSRKEVVDKLKSISQLRGEFKFGLEASKEYNSWYKPFRDSYMTNREATGIIGRIHMHVLKIAMHLAANDLTLQVSKTHIEQAIHMGLSLLPNYSTFTLGKGKSKISDAGGILIMALLESKNYTLSRKEFLRDKWQECDPDTLELVVTAFRETGHIRESMDRTQGMSYTLTDACLKTMGRVH